MKCGEKRTEQKKKDNKALLKIALCTHKKYDVWFTTAAFHFLVYCYRWMQCVILLNARILESGKKWKHERIYRQSIFAVHLIPNWNFSMNQMEQNLIYLICSNNGIYKSQWFLSSYRVTTICMRCFNIFIIKSLAKFLSFKN